MYGCDCIKGSNCVSDLSCVVHIFKKKKRIGRHYNEI